MRTGKNCVLLQEHTWMAAWSNLEEYVGSESLNTNEEEANAAAVSAATSEPGFWAETLYTLRGVSMSSGLSQHLWSMLGSPTCKY